MNEKSVVAAGVRGRCAYVCGARSLLHEALAACITQRLGLPCRVITDARDVREDRAASGAGPALFLVDSADAAFPGTIDDLKLAGGACADGDLFALYNLTANSGHERRGFEKGARGFFYRGDSLAQLSKGMTALFRGDAWIPRDILVELALKGARAKTRPAGETKVLTKRETQVLALLSAGARNEEIADKLRLSPYTIKTHLYNIFKKVGVPNRFQAALWAAKNL
jgi:DNA-binding NarL/FixJ family response regulator